MTQTRTKIYFAIKTEVDGFDLNGFKQFLSLDPTKFELKNSRGAVPRCTIWQYSLPEILHLDLGEELSNLIVTLTPHIDEFKNLKENFDVHYMLQIVLYHGDESPALYFSSEVLEFIHSIKAEIDCDMYNEK